MTITLTTRRTRLAVAAATGALALSAGLGACGSARSTDTARDAVLPAARHASTPAPDVPEVASVTLSGGPTTPSGGGSSSPAVDAPVIEAFITPDDIDCHNGNLQTFTASWTTTGASGVSISIDGPGVYAEYPADGEADLPFNCSSPHTFVLTAHGTDGTRTSSQITLRPRNVQDDEDQLVRTTAKVEGGSTGQGGATDQECEAYAGQMEALISLSDAQISNGDIEGGLDTADASGAIQNLGEDRGCFFGFT